MNKTATRKLDRVIEDLRSQFPKITGIKSALGWSGTRNPEIIHLGNIAEGGCVVDSICKAMAEDSEYAGLGFDEGTPAADYYGEFRGGYPWVHPDVETALKKIGYHIEWYDPGTILAYPD